MASVTRSSRYLLVVFTVGLLALHAGAGEVLFMGQAGVLGNTDPLVIARIEALGHTVTFVEHDDAAAWAAALPTADLVLISSTTSSDTGVATIGGGNVVRDLAIPLMCFEDYVYDEMQTLPSFGNAVGTQVTIANDAHPLAGGLSAGLVTVYTSPVRINHGSALSGAGGGAVAIATVNAGANAPILYYDTGDPLVDGTLAPAPRLNFFLHDDTFDDLTPDGLKLFDAAIGHMIPEPLSVTLLAVGALAILRRRR
ncbi:hypothetical protein LCGC14_2085950 [marine sediment metagenome]|uniref:PEP-CTERM protein-sorting domain-containing protein n=1 Tax=marine sediment metagenome TaxID=412755 RepID=A0A0F9EE40_9ZZZZ